MQAPVPTDILVQSASRHDLDQVVSQLGFAHVLDGPMVDGCYVVRVFGDPSFIEYAIREQGYGEVVRRLDEPL